MWDRADKIGGENKNNKEKGANDGIYCCPK